MFKLHLCEMDQHMFMLRVARLVEIYQVVRLLEKRRVLRCLGRPSPWARPVLLKGGVLELLSVRESSQGGAGNAVSGPA